jgi:hypothetical protein
MVRLYVKSFKKAVGKENIVIDKPFFQYLGSRAFPGMFVIFRFMMS